MNTEHLRYFLITAECGSIGRASEYLHLKQQHLSSVIKSLEQQLNVTLFTRHSRGVTLTEDGQYVLAKAKEITQLTDELQLEYLYPSNEIYKNTADDITLYTIPNFGTTSFGTWIADYRHYFPNVTLNIIESNRAHLLQAITDNHAALGLTAIMEDMDSFQQSLPTGLRAIYYRTMDLVALTAVPYEHLSISPTELCHLPLIAYAPKGLKCSLVYRVLSPYGKPNIECTVENTSLFLSLIQKGNYYSLAARGAFPQAGLVEIALKDTPTISLCIIVRDDALASFTIKSLLNLLLTQAGHAII